MLLVSLLRRNVSIVTSLAFLTCALGASLGVPPWHDAEVRQQPLDGAGFKRPSDRIPVESSAPPGLPADYHVYPKAQPFCSQRFGVEYLESLSNNSSQHCAPDSSSSLTCFHSQTHTTGRVDSFCVGGPASLADGPAKKISLGCRLQEDGYGSGKAPPPLWQFPYYWYETGPRVLFNNFIELSENASIPDRPPGSPRSISILVTREEPVGNLWHHLMQIWSFYMTIDVLRMAKDPQTHQPFFSEQDAQNAQVIILDNWDDGPFIEMWQLFASKPILRWEHVAASQIQGRDVIVPLPGYSNPYWEGDWEVHECGRSDLLETFSSRILSFYNVSTRAVDIRRPEEPRLILTYIDRTHKRRLDDKAYFIALVRDKYPHVRVDVVDFAAIPFREQLEAVRRTDVLVGVHGAGLTHAMFLRPGSAVVEVLPPDMDYKGFANLARMRSIHYFGDHASKLVGDKGDWHDDDVDVDEDKFLALVDGAIKSVSPRRLI